MDNDYYPSMRMQRVYTDGNGQTAPLFFNLSHFCILKLLKYFEIGRDAPVCVCACIEMIADGIVITGRDHNVLKLNWSGVFAVSD